MSTLDACIALTSVNVHDNDYSKCSRNSMACVWLGWTMALHGVSVGVVSSYSEWLNWYAAAVCVWSHRARSQTYTKA